MIDKQQLADLRAENERLREALVDIISICGGVTTDRVSTEFLLRAPGEVRLCVANMSAQIERLRGRNEKLERVYKSALDAVNWVGDLRWQYHLVRALQNAKEATDG